MGGVLAVVLEAIRRNQFLHLTSRIILTLIQLWVSTWTVLWVSIFIYVLFYNMYMPVVSTTKEVYIQYDSICHMKSTPNSCQIPFANIALTEGRSPQFVRGQTYQLSIDLNLPESEVNWSQGLFMVRLTLFDQNHNIALNVAKPTGLKYKSYALRGVLLLLYWPLYAMGLAEETQHIYVDLINDFIEGSHPGVGPTTEAVIEFEARDIQIYPPTILTITANLTGLRYYMYNWRLISFLMGTSTLGFFLYILTIIGITNWYNRQMADQNNHNNIDNGEDMDPNNIHIFEEFNGELEDDVNPENDDQNNEEVVERAVNQELEEDFAEHQSIGDLDESGLMGDLSANESEASSTVVIPENEDTDDLQPLPDSSSDQ